jgi:type I restriction enzyme M protein
MADMQHVVKNMQNIMRKDAGVDGDAQRLSQLVWMLFLKIFDDKERDSELVDPAYTSPIPEHLRWRSWAQDPEGITGEELLQFIEKELFPTLKTLPVHHEDPSARIVRSVFADSYNYMKNGTLIRQVINKLQEINFNKTHDRHQFGDIYEGLLKDLQSAGNAGEFYTPRPLTTFVVEMVAPTLGETVLDPACGTGGFLVSALEYVRGQGSVHTQADEQLLQASIHGVELKQMPHALAITNFMLHGVEDPTTITRDDMLARKALTEYNAGDRVDVIVANPPFGGVVADGVEKNFPSKYRTNNSALLFLLLFAQLLKKGGRAGIVLPDGVLFGEGVTTEIKRHLLETCNLHTIVRLPQGVFNPYAGVNTNLLFFTKGEPTQEVWYYHMPLPEGMKQYTKGKPITHKEFDPVRAWWNERVENEHAHKVSIEEIQEKKYNLDIKHPKAGEKEEQVSSEELKKRVLEREEEIVNILKKL